MKRLVILSLFLSTTALAQPAEPEVAMGTPTVQSILPNLFATNPGLTIDARFDYSDLDGIDATVINLFAHVQYVTPQGFGAYAQIPFGYVGDGSDDLFDFGGSGIGNIEVGGLYVTKVAPKTDLLARGGISIDTASEDDGLALLLSTILPRMNDTYASGLETTWARGHVQLRHAVDSIRLGGSIGMDVPIAGDGADADGFVGIVSGVVAGGLEQGRFGAGVSLSMLQPITDDEDDENIMGLNLGADYAVSPTARMFVQLGLSLEDNSDGLSIGIGGRATL